LQAEQERRLRQQQEMEKNKYREDVIKNMISIEEQRKHTIKDKRERLDQKVQMT
jgi:hypothetical protein